eukprot:CAMPEP_0201223090 /NCGR_PEP_ID=MMETSP0851-20130426/192939_1 /ASSEMBLY_ACC=CAM_ASM_000631 /TAXON_ID=183588 /ORGANISM="Pseudo-nitzschia fraudulenta, Strain WWA7" /LENGTH=139 /DNA_ID=CAMNT_0047512849 /DNA_START=743 /DNA_END=1159 /DNA_ORIENTATION=-
MPLNRLNNNNSNSDVSSSAPPASNYSPCRVVDEDHGITIQEDETCFLLSIEMPNVSEKDVEISLRRNILTISGFRRSRSYSDTQQQQQNFFDGSYNNDRDERRPSFSDNNRSMKRQRLSRQLEIDPNAIDIDRAMASIW